MKKINQVQAFLRNSRLYENLLCIYIKKALWGLACQTFPLLFLLHSCTESLQKRFFNLIKHQLTISQQKDKKNWEKAKSFDKHKNPPGK